MGLFGGLFGGGGDTIRGTLEGAGGLARDVRAAITGEIDPEKRAELEAQAAQIEADLARAQAAINEAEAASGSVFVAGWRPALGWTFAAIIALHYLVRPLAEWILQAAAPEVLPLPTFDLEAIWPAVLGMLGLAGTRTVEKLRGVQGRH